VALFGGRAPPEHAGRAYSVPLGSLSRLRWRKRREEDGKGGSGIGDGRGEEGREVER